ncbi:unnamed protein product [Ilex paraguariensis]|uniref:Uncharacterized protein n=1 Tax=Ilex paraguariensis TaxID=185542 RepID=A0ABC8R3U6_9AQUA
MFFQVYEALEHKLAVAEAAQRLRLPLISKDGEIQEEEIEKWSIMSRSSLDSTSTSFTISSNSTNYTNISAVGTSVTANNAVSGSAVDAAEPGVGGPPNRFLGITAAYLRQTQLQHSPLCMDMAEYQMPLLRGVESQLKAKCDNLADACVLDDFADSSTGNPNTTAQLPESALEHSLLRETYTQESIPELHKIRKFLVEATEEASLANNKVVTCLREYQGVDPHFDLIVRQYQDIVKVN